MNESSVSQIELFRQVMNNFPLASDDTEHTIANIFGKEFNENFISDWLAYLIHPDNIGTLKALESLLLLSSPNNEISFAEGEKITIQREYAFPGSGRRIDLIIQTDSLLIGIENKILAETGDHQLDDYKFHLEGLASSWGLQPLLIFLHPKTTRSAAPSGVSDIIYDDLVDEFKKIPINIYKCLRGSVLMQDFITHMEQFIIKDNNMDFSMINYLQANQETIGRIINAKDRTLESIISDIAKNLSILKEDDDIWDDIRHSKSGKWFQLCKTTWKPYLIHFELENTSSNSLESSKYRVLLHCERSSGLPDGFKQKFNKVQSDFNREANYGINVIFTLDYRSKEYYSVSFGTILTAMKEAVRKYTLYIDELVQSFE